MKKENKCWRGCGEKGTLLKQKQKQKPVGPVSLDCLYRHLNPLWTVYIGNKCPSIIPEPLYIFASICHRT